MAALCKIGAVRKTVAMGAEARVALVFRIVCEFGVGLWFWALNGCGAVWWDVWWRLDWDR